MHLPLVYYYVKGLPVVSLREGGMWPGSRYQLQDVVAAVKESVAVARGGKVLLEG